MRKMGFILIALVVLVLEGCSSNDNTAENVAKTACQAFKRGSIAELKVLMNDEERSKFSKMAEPFLAAMFKTKDFQQKVDAIDCKKPTKVHEYDAKRYKFSFGKFRTKVKNVEGIWIVSN